MPDYEEITLAREGRVALLTLNRLQKLNALTPRMLWHEIPPALREVETDPEVGALVITGAGKGFSSGADVSGLNRSIGTDPAPQTPPSAHRSPGGCATPLSSVCATCPSPP